MSLIRILAVSLHHSIARVIIASLEARSLSIAPSKEKSREVLRSILQAGTPSLTSSLDSHQTPSERSNIAIVNKDGSGDPKKIDSNFFEFERSFSKSIPNQSMKSVVQGRSRIIVASTSTSVSSIASSNGRRNLHSSKILKRDDELDKSKFKPKPKDTP